MLQAEAQKLFEAERLLLRALERKALAASLKRDLQRAAELVNQAISFEDDEHCSAKTDDE
jgi:hypothetical protein